jgi:hypothetical protein
MLHVEIYTRSAVWAFLACIVASVNKFYLKLTENGRNQRHSKRFQLCFQRSPRLYCYRFLP